MPSEPPRCVGQAGRRRHPPRDAAAPPALDLARERVRRHNHVSALRDLVEPPAAMRRDRPAAGDPGRSSRDWKAVHPSTLAPPATAEVGRQQRPSQPGGEDVDDVVQPDFVADGAHPVPMSRATESWPAPKPPDAMWTEARSKRWGGGCGSVPACGVTAERAGWALLAT